MGRESGVEMAWLFTEEKLKQWRWYPKEIEPIDVFPPGPDPLVVELIEKLEVADSVTFISK